MTFRQVLKLYNINETAAFINWWIKRKNNNFLYKNILNEKYQMKLEMVDRYSYTHAIVLGCVQNLFYRHGDETFSWSKLKNNKDI